MRHLVALYKWIDCDAEYLRSIDLDYDPNNEFMPTPEEEMARYDEFDDSVRISEWIEVNFPERSKESQALDAKATFDRLITRAKAENEQRIVKLEEQRMRFLQLSYDGDNA